MKKNFSNKGVKRPGSTISIASAIPKKQSRKSVEVSEHTWLDVFKYLSCPKWSKMRLVSHQLNGVVDRNVSRLPLAIIESVAMKMKERKKTEIKLIISDATILPDEKEPWFMDRDIAIYLPADIQLNNAIVGVEFKKNSCADLCVLGPAQEEELTPYEKRRPWFSGHQFKAEVIFYAEFSPQRNKYSWASMAFFLKLLYDPSTFVKELSMYSLDKKLKDVLFPDELKRYIRCGSFTPQAMKSAKELCNSCDQSRTRRRPSSFLSSFDKKFRTTATVHSIFPIILLSGFRRIRNDPLGELLSGKDILEEATNSESDDESEESDYHEIYTISNGRNRMRIEFVREPEKPRDPNVGCCLRYAYGYDIRVTMEAIE